MLKLKYVGHILSKTGLNPDPLKVKAVANIMQIPQTLGLFQQFLLNVPISQST